METAARDLRNYQPEFAENVPKLDAALEVLDEESTDEYGGFDLDL